jgi:hypothetical protein
VKRQEDQRDLEVHKVRQAFKVVKVHVVCKEPEAFGEIQDHREFKAPTG